MIDASAQGAGGSQPFALRERSRPLSVCYMPSEATLARRSGLINLPGDFPCYELGSLRTTFNCCMPSKRENLRNTLIAKFHASRFFTGKHDVSDPAVAQSWNQFLLNNSNWGANGSRVMTRTHLKNLQHKIEQDKKK